MTTKYILRQDIDPTTQEPDDKGFLFCLTDTMGNSSSVPTVPTYFWLSQKALNGKEMVENILAKFRKRMSIYSDEVGYAIYDKVSDPEYNVGHNSTWTRVQISHNVDNMSNLEATAYFVNFLGSEGTILSGISDPPTTEGIDGDFYFNTVTAEFFGPKGDPVPGVWPTPGVSLKGPSGGIQWKGAWNNSTAYLVNDVVEYQGSSYIAIQDHTAENPTLAPTYWELVAQKGDDGVTGPAGDSAYQVWEAQPANTGGTVTDFLNDIKGAQGDPGPTGATGPQGIQGVPGSNGADGASAYQIWLAQPGNSGNIAAFLESLEGKSAYEIWEALPGNAGMTEQQFADSLVGPPGPAGAAGAAGDPGLTWMGDWSNSSNYVVNDGVFYQGSSYICILDTTTMQDPTDNTYWELLAQKGEDGKLSAQCFGYNYSSTTISSDPGSGNIRLNNTSVNLATEIYINESDINNDNIESFINVIAAGTSSIPGHIKLTLKSDSTTWGLWSINSITNNTTWYSMSVTFISGDTGVIFNDTDDIDICFARTGDKGADGADGNTVLYGSSDPTTEGNDGDFYINTTTNTIFGPKGVPTPGTWPSGTSLIGPTGPQGPIGPAGPAGAGIIWQGYWNSGTTYNENDAVFHEGSSYICIASNTNQEPPNATYWEFIAAGLNWKGPHMNIDYNMFDVVEFNGSSYICIQDTTTMQDPTDGSYWDLLVKRGSKFTSELDHDPTVSGNPTENPNPTQFDHHINHTSGGEILLYEYNGTMWVFVDYIISLSNPIIQTIENEAKLQSSYQFRLSADTGSTTTGFYTIGSDGGSSHSVPTNGRLSSTHIGFLTDDFLTLDKIILTIQGATTKNGTTPTPPYTLQMNIRVWNATDTTAIPCNITIPSSSIGGTILAQNNANGVNSVIVHIVDTPPVVMLDEAKIFGLEFVTGIGNSIFAAIDNTHIKLIFRAT